MACGLGLSLTGIPAFPCIPQIGSLPPWLVSQNGRQIWQAVRFSLLEASRVYEWWSILPNCNQGCLVVAIMRGNTKINTITTWSCRALTFWPGQAMIDQASRSRSALMAHLYTPCTCTMPITRSSRRWMATRMCKQHMGQRLVWEHAISAVMTPEGPDNGVGNFPIRHFCLCKYAFTTLHVI